MYLGYVSQNNSDSDLYKSLVMGLILPHGTRGQNQLVLVSNGSLSVLLCFGF